MKPDEIKNAFKQIASAAQNDNLLTHRISEKLARPAEYVPIEELKVLFKYFIIILLPTIAVYILLASFAIDIPQGNDFETMIERNMTLSWSGENISLGGNLVFFTFLKGLIRAFSILLVLAFTLAAAGMPVRHREELKGGLPCTN